MTVRQRVWAASISLNAMAMPAAKSPSPPMHRASRFVQSVRAERGWYGRAMNGLDAVTTAGDATGRPADLEAGEPDPVEPSATDPDPTDDTRSTP